jgi:hypothetical protein
VNASTAATATNATQLGGVASTNYARVDQGNTFTGVNVLGNSTAGTGGLVIPPNGSGFNKNSFLFNLQSTGASLTNTFGFQASTTPSLNLMFCNSAANCAPAATGLSIASNGVITFAAGQTFPGAGAGTVTSFSAGTLAPLFTTSVATSTSTPALSFNLNTQSAHTVFAGPASGTAAPTFRSLLADDIPGLPESQITNLATDLTGLQSNISAETTRATGAESNITGNLNSEITRAQNAEGTEAVSRAAADVALSASVSSETVRATAAEGSISTSLGNEVSRATAAEASKADLDGGNIFTGGSQKLAASTATYPSLNVPSSSTPLNTPVAGDVWLTNSDLHLQFHDKNNATHSLMFSDDTINNTQLSNSSFGVTLGSGLSGSSSVALGGNLSLSNTGVLSFNGRTGSVSPTSGDYSFSQISGAITSAQAGRNIRHRHQR